MNDSLNAWLTNMMNHYRRIVSLPTAYNSTIYYYLDRFA